ncbi:MAG: transglycosylase SLT domain-containing protein [Clostridia bacterium]|nr:transglycosylase SLT domain-containing protein [Clostridia bacterium]
MKDNIVHILRKSLTIVCMILVFATIGLLSITTQVKTVTLNYYGSTKTVRTLASSIDTFLLQNKIYVNEETQVLPNKTDKIVDGMEITISSEKELAKIDIDSMKADYSPMVAKFEEVIESIPFEEETKDNPEIDKGTTQTVQEGVEGQKTTSYIVRYNNNEEIERAEVNSEILAEARNKVVEVGTRVTVSRSALVNSVVSAPVDGGFRAYNIALPVEQQQYAYNLCNRYGIDYETFLAIMYKESGYNPNALGGGNSYGLCQIHISNHTNLMYKLGISNFFDPYDNMAAGAYLFSYYMGTYGDTVTALNAYNGRIANNSYGDSVLYYRSILISNGGL